MNNRSRLYISRRSGCTTCKARHKKCDEQKPRCKNCTRLDLVCRQPDLFRGSKLSPSHTRRMHDSVAHQLKEPIESSQALVDTNHGIIFSPFNPNLSEWMKLLPIPHASPMEDYLMQHYIEKSSSVLVNVHDPINTLRSIILPRAVTSQMLINALYATSSLHAFIHNNQPEYRVASLTYYNKASTALRQSITGPNFNTTAKDRELSLLTSVFLCKFEIISGGFANWRQLLRGLQKMLSIFQRNDAGLSQETLSYIQSL